MAILSTFGTAALILSAGIGSVQTVPAPPTPSNPPQTAPASPTPASPTVVPETAVVALTDAEQKTLKRCAKLDPQQQAQSSKCIDAMTKSGKGDPAKAIPTGAPPLRN